MRLRKRAVGLLLGAGILFLIGTNVQAGWLYVLAALLLGALVAGLVLPFAALRGLSIELVVPDEAEQGMPTIDVLPRADRSEMFRWLASLQPSGIPLEATLDGLGPEDLRGIQTIVIALPIWGRGGRDRLYGAVRRLVHLV